MKTINLLSRVGTFAENKDIAREIRINEMLPILENNEKIILNFEGIEAATQSFIHALISDLIRKRGINVLDEVYFKNCNTTVQKVINIVIDYMQDIEP